MVKLSRELIDEAFSYLVDRQADRFADHIWDHHVEGRLKSPIEAAFFVWWEAFRVLQPNEPYTDYLHIFPQLPIKCGGSTYKADFFLASQGERATEITAFGKSLGVEFPKVIFELDGHEFHERTKQQVAHRDQRDRDLQLAGYKVFHISGSVMFHRPGPTVEGLFEECRLLIIHYWKVIASASGKDLCALEL